MYVCERARACTRKQTQTQNTNTNTNTNVHGVRQVEARWRLAAGTAGTVKELCCIDPYDPDGSPARLTALFVISSGPWTLTHTRLQSNGGAVVRVVAEGRGGCATSLLQGLDSRDLRAQLCVSVEDAAEWECDACVLQDAFSLVRAIDTARVRARGCALEYGDTGVTLQHQARVDLRATCLRRLRLGAFNAFGNTQAGSALHLQDCYGADCALWATPRRPHACSVDAASCFDQVYWALNEERLVRSPAMRSPIVRRALATERVYVPKEASAEELAQGAEVRAENRRLLSTTLNRHHAWLYRRRRARHYLLYAGEKGQRGAQGDDLAVELAGIARGNLSASPQVWIKEVDSEEDLYDQDFAFTTRTGAGQSIPNTLDFLDARGLSQVEVGTEYVQRWRRNEIWDPDNWDSHLLTGNFNESGGYQPPAEVQGMPVAHLPVEFREVPRSGLNNLISDIDCDLARGTLRPRLSHADTTLATQSRTAPPARTELVPLAEMPLATHDAAAMQTHRWPWLRRRELLRGMVKVLGVGEVGDGDKVGMVDLEHEEEQGTLAVPPEVAQRIMTPAGDPSGRGGAEEMVDAAAQAAADLIERETQACVH